MALLNTAEAAEMLRIKKGTLNIWRCTKRYDLPYVKIGRKIFYKTEDIYNFIKNNTIWIEK